MLFGVGQKVLFLIVHRKFFDFCVRQHSNNREGSIRLWDVQMSVKCLKGAQENGHVNFGASYCPNK